MDDFLKLVLAFGAVYALIQLTEPQPYAAPYYVPWQFPWTTSAFFRFPGARFPVPRPPLGGEEVEMGGGGHMGAGGFHGGGQAH